MDIFGRKALQRQQALVTSLRERKLAVAQNFEEAVATAPLQPHDPAHPGSDVYLYADFTINTWRIWHVKFFALYPTNVTYLVPAGPIPAGGFPVIAVSPGKFLDHQLLYSLLLQHICRKGYIVLFIDSDTGLVDCQHSRMAGEFLEILKQTIVKRLNSTSTLANPNQVAWWGHSMGAKVQAIAAQMSSNRFYSRPTAILANNFSNDRGNFCNDDAVQTANRIPPTIWYTLIRGDQDSIVGDDPQRLYAALRHLNHSQLIKAVSYPADGLKADHLAALADGITSKPDALDWWLYWKIAVGAFDYHFKAGPDKWAYGTERENGGTDAAGRILKHVVEIENFVK